MLAHEISHVTQDHVLRGVERAQRDSVPILLAMLGAILVAQQAGGNSSDDASMAALSAGQALMYQRQIDYTRDNEAEADRVGMQTLARSGYDPKAMAEFFTTLQGWVRANQGGSRERTPDYLQTHPITVTRISEAKERAATMKATNNFAAPTTANPMLPGNIRLPEASLAAAGTGQFGWAKERMRVLSANTPAEAVREYEQMRHKAPLDDAQQYGLALARLQGNQPSAAMVDLDDGAEEVPQRHVDPTRDGRSRSPRRQEGRRRRALPAPGRPHAAQSRGGADLRAGPGRTRRRRIGQEGAGDPARPGRRWPPTIRSTRRPSPARATWPAIPSAPAKPMPRPST